MEESPKTKISWLIISSIFSIILANLGIMIFEKEKIIAIITMMIAFLSIYFMFYIYQIKENRDNIKEIKEWTETNGEVLNTIKDIVILRKISKIK